MLSSAPGRLILIRRPVFKLASLKDIREGNRLDCLEELVVPSRP